LAFGLRLRRRHAVCGRDFAEYGADLDGFVGLDVDRGQRARGGSGDLGVDLVGRDVDERLVGLDRVADLLAPFEDGSLGHGLAHRGHRDLDRRASGHLLQGQ
jgi:hypothetical protein